MPDRKATENTLAEILIALSGFKTGVYTQSVGASNNPTLSPIVDKVNELAKRLELQAQAEAESKAFLNTVLSSLPSLISYLSPDLTFKYVNSAYEKWFGISKEQCQGRSVVEVIGPAAADVVRPKIEAALRGEEQHFEQQNVPYRTGGQRHVQINYIPDRASDGQVVGIVVIVHDLTALVEARLKTEVALVSSLQNEKSFRAVFDNSPLGILKIDGRYRFLLANAACADFLGYSEAELKNLTILDVTHPEDLGLTLATLKTFPKETKLIQRLEKRFLHKSGKTKWGLVTSRAVQLDETGEEILFTVIEDVTEIKENEQELRKAQSKLTESENYLAAILNSVSQGIWGLDTDGRMTFVNQAGIKMLGCSTAAELSGRPMHSLVHPNLPKEQAMLLEEGLQESSSASDSNLDEIYQSGSQATTEILWRKDGTSLPISYFCAPIYIDGKCIGSVVSVEDLTERQKMEKEIGFERQKSIQNAKLASLGELSAGIAHEINNPLTVIMGSVPLLTSLASNPEKLAGRVESIQKASHRISKIVNGLQKFSKSGNKAKFTPHCLNDIVKEVLVLTEGKAKRSQVPVLSESKTEARILCDELGIEQVLINLVNNATDAAKDTKDKWVKVSVHEEISSVVFRIIDSGPGIPEPIRNKMFEPFFTTKKVGEGTGLGLSVSKGILDEHQASISVNAEVPNTCFEIRFPKIAS